MNIITIQIGLGLSGKTIKGTDERSVTIQAEEMLREAIMKGAGASYSITCSSIPIQRRIYEYLAGVGDEIFRMGARISASRP